MCHERQSMSTRAEDPQDTPTDVRWGGESQKERGPEQVRATWDKISEAEICLHLTRDDPMGA